MELTQCSLVTNVRLLSCWEVKNNASHIFVSSSLLKRKHVRNNIIRIKLSFQSTILYYLTLYSYICIDCTERDAPVKTSLLIALPNHSSFLYRTSGPCSIAKTPQEQSMEQRHHLVSKRPRWKGPLHRFHANTTCSNMRLADTALGKWFKEGRFINTVIICFPV